KHRGAICYVWLAGKGRVRCDKSCDLHHLSNLVQRTKHTTCSSQAVERAHTSKFFCLFWGDEAFADTDFARVWHFSLHHRELSTRIHEVTDALSRNICCYRGRNFRNFK